ncbi:MAG: HNH endonuclease [Proteobacteria bacterium]|nr:HNH endonuclease [Pseudomonadota bacterium]
MTVYPDDDEIRKERNKARDLRKSQWWKRQCAKGLCHYCNKAVKAADLTMDHVVPLVRGGRSTRGNVVAACKDCNTKKQSLLPMEWEEYMDHLAK